MSAPSGDRSSAYRYLHVNLNCRELDATSAFYAGVFDARETMRSGGPDSVPHNGKLLGLDRDVHTGAAFVYDYRGPRACGANELVEWYDPPTEGQPYPGLDHLGIQGIGYAVPVLTTSVDLALSRGATPSALPDLSAVIGTPAVTVLDPGGVQLDIVAAGGDTTTLRHLRQNVRDLDASRAWYETVGFATSTVRTARVGNGADATDVRVAELVLPDEAQRLLLVEGLVAPGRGTYDTAYHAGLFRSALAVPDATAAHERLAAAGCADGAELHERVLEGTKVGFLRILVLRDPDGVLVELVERDRAIFR